MASDGSHASITVNGPTPLKAPSGGSDTGALLRGLSGHEALSQPFEYRVDLLYNGTSEVKFDDVLGKDLGIEMELPEGTRHIHGVVAELGFAGSDRHWKVYQAVLRPWLWLLTRTADSRIFQDLSALEIIKQVFSDQGFSDFADETTATYPKRVYCVQYRETDFDFVNRLMEEEGIYYFFKYEKTKHTLVLADSSDAHSSLPGYSSLPYRPGEQGESRELESVSEWLVTTSVRSGVYSLRDFDFEKPKTDLTAKSSDPADHSQAKMEVYDYHPGRYDEAGRGKALAAIRRESLQVDYELYKGRTDARGLSVGATWKLEDHPTKAINKEYLIIEANHRIASDEPELGGSQDDFTVQVQADLVCIDHTRPYRPPIRTPKAVVRGPQTAVVVGGKNEEIWTDKFGRVKVQFHWDREGKSDETSSCWVRVSHAWAGKKWGQIFLPRIGQEVIVDFLEGDPDQPIITGRVYNADNMPPYTLPADKNKSTMKSHSTLKGVDANFNELRFDDTKDKEQVYFHAERDFERVVENDDKLKVGFEKKDAGDQTIEIYNNQNITIGSGSGEGSQTLTIEKDRTTTLNTGDDTLTVSQGDRKISISAGKQETDASKHILLKVGQSSIKIEPAKITIKSTDIVIEGKMGVKMKAGMNMDLKAGMVLKAKGGMQFKAEGGMMAELKSGLMTTVKGGAMLTLKGGITMIN